MFFDEREPDSGSTSDAMADAYDCGHTFCDDFDRGGPVEAGWDMYTMTSGTASLATDMSVSPPQSLLISIPTDGTTTTTGNAFLKKQLPLATSRVVVHTWLSYATATTMNTEADLLALKWDTLPSGCTDFGFYLVRDGTGPFNLQETYAGAGICSGGSVQNPNVTLDNMPFTEVTLEVTIGTQGTAWLKLTLDGAIIVDKEATHPIGPSTIRLEVGGGVSRNGLAPWTVRFDDLTVDVDR